MQRHALRALRTTTTGSVRPALRRGALPLEQAPPARRRAARDRPRVAAAAVGLLDLAVGDPRTTSISVDGTATRSSPQRSITTWVTAVVSGSTSRKLVPWPGVLAVSMRPPIALTSARTTSMPTPRPASSVTLARC
jgi:hypothetical protein